MNENDVIRSLQNIRTVYEVQPEPIVTLTNIELAALHIETAIYLTQAGDIMCATALAHAAEGVLVKVIYSMKKETCYIALRKQLASLFKIPEKEVGDTLRMKRNFLNHGNRVNSNVTLSTEEAVLAINRALFDYRTVTGKWSPQMAAFADKHSTSLRGVLFSYIKRSGIDFGTGEVFEPFISG